MHSAYSGATESCIAAAAGTNGRRRSGDAHFHCTHGRGARTQFDDCVHLRSLLFPATVYAMESPCVLPVILPLYVSGVDERASDARAVWGDSVSFICLKCLPLRSINNLAHDAELIVIMTSYNNASDRSVFIC